MQEKTEQINLFNTEKTRLPFGYRKICLDKIPLAQIEKKLMIYNKKYKFSTMQILAASKPISKILK